MQSKLKEKTRSLLSIKEASQWATEYLKRDVTSSNISYLIQYGKIKKIDNNGATVVAKSDLIEYYNSYYGKRELNWKNKLGEDLDWHLSFDHLRESDTTKHVHRLHPYKGKFIPQLVEYFLDDHKDEFKKEVYFKKGDTIIDPFCGSGTTLIQANELGMHAIGIDISEFNSIISNIKVKKSNLYNISNEIKKINIVLEDFLKESRTIIFEEKLLSELYKFNSKYFPSPSFKYKVGLGNINEYEYGEEKEKEFSAKYNKLINEYNIELNHRKTDSFLDKWYMNHVRKEINIINDLIKNIENVHTKQIISIILSRTIRSCRATTHSDLATLKEPVLSAYYCAKHKKICKPLFSIMKWWKKYSEDTLERLKIFENIRTNTNQLCLVGDSRNIDIFQEIKKENIEFYKLLKTNKISGIFSSPPYVGLIDYHEQHAYAYELYGLSRKDELEIGPLFKGMGKDARDSYVFGVSDVLINCKKYLKINYDVFLVANDKFDLYPNIAKRANMKIKNIFKRPVLNRTEKDKGAYSEKIFHLKEK